MADNLTPFVFCLEILRASASWKFGSTSRSVGGMSLPIALHYYKRTVIDDGLIHP